MPLTASYMATVVMAYVRPAPGVLVWMAGLPDRTASSVRCIQRVATLPALLELTPASWGTASATLENRAAISAAAIKAP